MNGVIRQILIDHGDKFVEKHKETIRQVVVKEIKKVKRCGDITYGHTEYKCPDCGEIKRVGFTCKSRLCTSCGKVKTDEWQTEVSNTIGEVRHRHIVFTIPEELRHLFLIDRKLLKNLIDEAAEVVLNYYRLQRKTKKYVPGIICALHTYGRDLKWNPHVHMLVTEGVIVDDEYWKQLDFIPYEALRNSWKYLCLRIIQRRFRKDRKIIALVNKIYKEKEYGFYVYAKPTMLTAVGTAKYIGRYVSKPAIAEGRITGYDGKNITFWYQRHEDNKKVEETITAEEFIGKLVRHVPDRQFKMVRYYGIYSRRKKNNSLEIFNRIGRKMKRKCSIKEWRQRIIKAFGIDPIKCPKCGKEMEFNDIYYWKCGSLIERSYEIMAMRVDKQLAQVESA